MVQLHITDLPWTSRNSVTTLTLNPPSSVALLHLSYSETAHRITLYSSLLSFSCSWNFYDASQSWMKHQKGMSSSVKNRSFIVQECHENSRKNTWSTVFTGWEIIRWICSFLFKQFLFQICLGLWHINKYILICQWCSLSYLQLWLWLHVTNYSINAPIMYSWNTRSNFKQDLDIFASTKICRQLYWQLTKLLRKRQLNLTNVFDREIK